MMTSRGNRIMAGIIYSISLLFGVFTLVFPSPAISGAIGISFIIVYGVLITGASLACLYGIIKPNFKVENVAIWPLAGGLAIYLLSLVGVFFDRVNNPTLLPPAYGPILVGSIALVFLVWRIIWLTAEARLKIKQYDHGHI